MRRRRPLRPIDAAPNALRSSLERLVPEAVRESLDRRAAEDLVAVYVDQRVQLHERELAVPAQQRQAEGAQRGTADRPRLHALRRER